MYFVFEMILFPGTVLNILRSMGFKVLGTHFGNFRPTVIGDIHADQCIGPS